MKNTFDILSKCVCKSPLVISSLEGICSACFGRIPEDKSSRVQTPTLNPFQDSIFPKSKPNPGHSINHNRSNSSNRVEEPSSLLLKQTHKHSVSKPSTNSQKPLTNRDNSKEIYQVSSSAFSEFYKHHRALSSRVHKISHSPLQSRFNSVSELDPCIQITECVHKGHKNSVNSISIIQNKAYSAGSDYKIIGWPRLGNKYQSRCQVICPIGTYKGHKRKVQTLDGLSGSFLISAGQEEKIRIWNVLKDFKPISFIRSGESSVKVLSSLTEENVVSGSGSGSLKYWDVNIRTMVRGYLEQRSGITSICKLTTFTFFAGTEDGLIKLYDLRTSRQLSSFFHDFPVTSIVIWDGSTFYSAAKNIYKWDIRANTQYCARIPACSVSLEKTKSLLVSGGPNLAIYENDLPQLIYSALPQINCLKFNAFSEILYAGCKDSSLFALYIN